MTTSDSAPIGATFTYKFNPSFQSDAEAIDSFVVRRAELGSILEILRSNVGAARNQNVLITAPRGAGKTTLVRRVLAEVRTSSDLFRSWHPIFLGEESYTITTPGEFFLECLFHLQDHLQDQRWRALYDEVGAQRDEPALLRTALSALRGFAQEQQKQKRLLLIVENVHMIFTEQIGTESDALRRVLDEDTTFMMLATSVREAIGENEDGSDVSFVRDYRIVHLRPLDLTECQKLWEALTHQNVKQERIRPLQILTGGSPRLLRIMAEFAVTPSLQNLMENLNLLIDQNTEYFKSQLDGLPPTERKVFAALLDIWDPSTAKQVSESARVNVNIASAMLGRLADRGSVIKLPGKGRAATYHAAERLFNIYYLMRRRSHPSSRVRALVAFMTQYYRGDELIDTTAKLVAEACSLHPLRRQEYHSTFNAIIAQSSGEIRQRILSQTPDDFLSPIRDSAEFRSATAAIAASQRDEELIGSVVNHEEGHSSGTKPQSRRTKRTLALLKKVRAALGEKNHSLAEGLLREAIASNQTDGQLWLQLALVLRDAQTDSDEALSAAERAATLLPNDSMAHAILGLTLYNRNGNNTDIERHISKAIDLDPHNILALSTFGDIKHELGELAEALDYYRRAWTEAPDLEFALYDVISILGSHLGRHKEAEVILLKALETHPEWQAARNYLAESLAAQNRMKDAEAILRQGIERDEASPARWADLARFLFVRRRKYDEARIAFEHSIRLDEKRPNVWITYARVLQKLGNATDAAIEAVRTATKLEPESTGAWLALARIYDENGKIVEAESAFRKAIALDESSARSWFEFGMFLQDIPGRLSDSEAALRRAVASSEDYPCMVPKELAALLIHRGADKDAKPLLTRAVELNKDCYCSLTLLAGVASRERETDKAEKYFEIALEVNPEGITAMTGLAQLAIEQNSDLGLAGTLVDRAMAANPKDPRVLLARALLRRSQHAVQECLEDLGRALAIDPEFAEAQVLLALVEAQQGEAAKAISHLTDAMRWVDRRRELLSGIVDTAVILVQRGHIASVAQAIREADAVEYLEPLHVALEMLQGETPLVAKEVQEVATDIVGRITK